MSNFAKSNNKHIIMIQIPENEVQINDCEVLTQLQTGKDKYGEGLVGTAYIDWGVTSDYYQNCPSKSVADKVASAFKEKGYYVYMQRMGYCNRRILEGTIITVRFIFIDRVTIFNFRFCNLLVLWS